MKLCNYEDGGEVHNLVRVTPPQTNDADIPVGKGAYCFVIDVSGSMNAAAQITTDDGDKVNHGWSQLDIAKHSTNTFVSSLGDEDYVSIVTYSDNANVLLNWTKCDEAGRETAVASIHSMRPERSTNLMAGITTGFSQFDAFPEPDATLSSYALSLIITTDGMPSSQWHPARGRDGYYPLVKTLAKGLQKKRGAAACPEITSIGIGFQLDSELLTKMSQAFLHMPDPGQIGPFIVNLLAAVRSTARLPTPDGMAVNNAVLHITPADAVVPGSGGVVGYSRVKSTEDNGEEDVLVVPLGAMCYDQPRNTIVRTKPGAAFKVDLVINGNVVATRALADAEPARERDTNQMKMRTLQLLTCEALDAAAFAGASAQGAAAIVAPIADVLQQIRSSPFAAEDVLARLGNTVEKECMLGADDENFRKWGGHYFRTLPCMIRAERRSNFRDECMQHFGHDARNREGLFEAQSNAAEMRFATLTPPTPSLLQPQVPSYSSAGGMPATASSAPPPRAAPTVLPDEFMRGGGCFGPDATVQVLTPGGAVRPAKVSTLVAGDLLVGEEGAPARVRCVVLTACSGGKALLTRLPNGTELTEWHPLKDWRTGRWRFPHMLGERVVRSTPYVYNLVLEPGVPTVLVGGIACAALGHGLEEPTVAHPYWGTTAVIRDLMAQPGWAEGRVVMPAKSEQLE